MEAVSKRTGREGEENALLVGRLDGDGEFLDASDGLGAKEGVNTMVKRTVKPTSRLQLCFERGGRLGRRERSPSKSLSTPCRNVRGR